MRSSFLYAITFFLCLNVFKAHALEIDEKLTLRFLNVSSSKKTVLINRGAEDGLVVGDHAKFFITSGVVARGVSEKVSPSRSVWSLYRIVDPTEITQDKVLNLKISTPVKITEDPTKSMKEEAIPGGTESMDIGDAKALPESDAGTEVAITDKDNDELKELGGTENEEVTPKAQDKKSKTPAKKSKTKGVSVMEDLPVERSGGVHNWEAWGTLYFNSLSGTAENDVTSDSTSNVASSIDFSLGVEKYFLSSGSFLRELSLVGLIHKRSVENGSNVKSTSDWFEYGLGANYHFYNSALQYNRLIGYGTATFGKGGATIKQKVVNGSTTAIETT